MRDARFRLSPVAAIVAAALAPEAYAVTYTVTNTADAGAGSLRNAITQANSNCAVDQVPTIDFAIPGTGPFTIAPSSALPTMNCPSAAYSPTIDATTQSGWTANSSGAGFNGTFGIVLSGTSLAPPGGCGLHYNDPGSYGGNLTIRGLDVTSFTYGGVGQALCGTLQVYGTRVKASNTGIAIGGNTPNTIGTLALADRNVISDNTGAGISVSYGGTVSIVNNLIGTPDGVTAPSTVQSVGISWGGAPSGSAIDSNVISGNTTGINYSSDSSGSITNNLIGTNATGTAALPNAVGISGNFLNSTNITGNVLSGNTGNGIALQSVNSVTFSGNKVGTDSSGNTAIANGSDGMFVQCGTPMTISSNIFSGNVANGITVAGVDALNFNGNKVGVNAGGAALANGDSGVLLAAGSCAQYGSNGAFSNNILANNGVDGIALTSPLGVGNTLFQNSIYANGNKNININNTVGPLPNDAGDPDGGPNNQQNYPVISLVTQSGGNTDINYTLNSQASRSYQVEFFENTATGTPAGRTSLGFVGVTTDAAGNFTATATLFGLHDFISMTATDLVTGDTSEFALIVAVTPTPAVTITPTALAFGNVVVGTTSPSQTSTLTSSGTANYQITTFDTAASCYGAPLCYGGPFTCSTNCTTGTPYAPGNSCTITASFAPIVLGPQSSTIYICDNTSSSPNTITLSGTAVAPPPIAVNPSSQDFGTVPVGGTSLPVIFNFSNSGPAPAPISAPSVTGPFQITGTNCGAAILPSSSCNVDVVFTPSAVGLASGTLSMTSGTNTVTAGLAGTGTVAPILVLPPPIDLGAVLVGSTVTRTVTLTNSGGGPLTFSSIAVTAPFTLANNCPATLQPGQSCAIVIGVDSSTAGNFTGTLTIVSDGGSGTVALTANVQKLPIPVLKISPTTVGFGDRIVNSTSASQRITILNDGGADATITSITPSADFVVTGNTCGTNLPPSATCFVDVAMRAIGFGGRVGQLVVASNGIGAPQAVGLAGTGCRPFSATGVRTGPRSNCRP